MPPKEYSVSGLMSRYNGDVGRYPGTRDQGQGPVGSPGSGTSQGVTVECPWRYGRDSLGKPKKMAAEGPQGEASVYKKVTQGKFTGAERYSKNTKQAAPQALPQTAWPNSGTVWRGRDRNGSR